MKFNAKASPLAEQVARSLKNHPDATANAEGGVAFRPAAKQELYQRVLTCLFGESKYYEKADDTAREIQRLVAEVAGGDPEWVLKLAAYARQAMFLRSVPIYLLVLAADIPLCKPFVRKWTPAIVRRADEPAEVLAAWVSLHGDIGSRGQTPFPNSLKKGIADALGNFDEYQLEKYNSGGSVKIRDVLRVCRPAPGDRQALYKYLRWDWEHLTDEEKGKLPKIGALRALAGTKTFGPEAIARAREAHATWEVMISQYGNKAEVWDALDLPFMAGLRNLRNLLQAGSKVALPKFLAQLQDEKAVRRSKQLPFRFLSAYREVENAGGMNGRVMQALSQAMQLSVVNLPKLEGVTAVAADNSGSMANKLSAKSAVSYEDIANVFTALAGHLSDQGYSMAFGTDVAAVSINPADSILTNAQKVASADTKGMATNGFLIPVHLMGGTVNWTHNSYHSGYGFKKGHIVKTLSPLKVDRVLVFTDCQLYDASGENESLAQQMAVYRRTVNPNARLYVFNLAGYGTMQTPKDDPLSVEVAGWSEQVLRFIPMFEKGAEVGVNLIDRMTPAGVVSESEDL